MGLLARLKALLKPVVHVTVKQEILSIDDVEPENGTVCLVYTRSHWRQFTWFTMEEANVRTGWYNEIDIKQSGRYKLYFVAPEPIRSVEGNEQLESKTYIGSPYK